VYVTKIGFYSDDWSNISRFSFAEDQSIMGIFSVAYDDWMRMRPGQVLYQILLYKAFGLNPLGYHITNTLVILISALLCYTALQKLTGSRLSTLSIALLYSLLPHYSTDRLWYAAFQTTLSVSLYFLSVCADLRGVEAVGAVRTWGWKLLSVACLLISALCYELTIPLFFLSPFWIYLYQARTARSQRRDRRAACEYFASHNGKPGGGCPRGQPGLGVPMLRYRKLGDSVREPSMLVQSLEQTCGSLRDTTNALR
jgi:hypothetical protein